MALLNTPICDFNAPAPEFSLRTPSGELHTRDSAMGSNGLLIAFVCNHCPYVVAIAQRLGEDARALKAAGVNTVAIMSNDPGDYPADAPEHMQPFADRYGWDFPYLVDTDQSVGRAFGAVCTPDFFGYNRDFGLQYRGRLDDAGMGDAADRVPELLNAMLGVAKTGEGPQDQAASMGCSIKWSR